MFLCVRNILQVLKKLSKIYKVNCAILPYLVYLKMGNMLSNSKRLFRKGSNRVQPFRIQRRNELFQENTVFKVNTLKTSEEREFVWKNNVECNENVLGKVQDRQLKFADDADDNLSFQRNVSEERETIWTRNVESNANVLSTLHDRLIKFTAVNDEDCVNNGEIESNEKISSTLQHRLKAFIHDDEIEIHGHNTSPVLRPISHTVPDTFTISSGNVYFLPLPPVTTKPPSGRIRRHRLSRKMKTC